MRSTGWQPARFYEVAKVYEEHCPLRPVLSLPGSSYYNLNKVLAKFFEKIQGANFETNSLEARGVLESNKNCDISRCQKFVYECSTQRSKRHCSEKAV